MKFGSSSVAIIAQAYSKAFASTVQNSLRYNYTRRFHLNTFRKKNIAHKLDKTKINSLRFRFNLAHADLYNTKAFNLIASILLSLHIPPLFSFRNKKNRIAKDSNGKTMSIRIQAQRASE